MSFLSLTSHLARFFLAHGVIPSEHPLLVVEYGLTINGECSAVECNDPKFRTRATLYRLKRENVGFDFGAHRAMLEYLDNKGLRYDVYIFLNDGVTGPIIPSYMPKGWHWTQAFADKLVNNVGLVGTSIVCLRRKDLGGYGPKVEGFAFALSASALEIVRKNGTSFQQHANKKKAILSGEYNMTRTLLAHGVGIDCLLSAYQGVDWRKESEWGCNSMVHPSRSGRYFGISIHPLEVLFHKVFWTGLSPVAQPETTKFTEFQTKKRERELKSSPPSLFFSSLTGSNSSS
jgi:hypothetical protein